jgi:hypothetical protein
MIPRRAHQPHGSAYLDILSGTRLVIGIKLVQSFDELVGPDHYANYL